RVGTPEYLSMMRLRKIWAEGSFSALKREHCISKIRKRGILAATEECLLAAMALNLKRMANAIFFIFIFTILPIPLRVSAEFLPLSTGPILYFIYFLQIKLATVNDRAIALRICAVALALSTSPCTPQLILTKG
ncbi:MAG: transposase, partial [Petrimonas sp.]|nr:transposase [Petrimonas sp.]